MASATILTSVRERDIFAASTEQYIPILDGDSIVVFAETGQRAPGNLQFGLTYQDRLYFFRSAKEQALFEANPEEYVDADLVDQGYCVVSKVEEQKQVPGIPETVLTVDGLRYYFASDMHRRLFAAKPQRYVVSTDATSRDLQVRAGSDLGFRQKHSFDTPSAKKQDLSPAEAEAQEARELVKFDELESGFNHRPAVSGYCIVSIRKEGVWVRGKSKFKAIHDGKLYYMAGAEQLTAFLEDPREFTPVLGGDSIVTFAETAQRRPGMPIIR